MVNRWGFQVANQERGGKCLSQSGKRRELKKRDFKNVKVILLRDLTDLASRVVCMILGADHSAHEWIFNCLCANIDLCTRTYRCAVRTVSLHCSHCTNQHVLYCLRTVLYGTCTAMAH